MKQDKTVAEVTDRIHQAELREQSSVRRNATFSVLSQALDPILIVSWAVSRGSARPQDSPWRPGAAR